VTCISEEGGDLVAKAGHQISPMYSLNSIGVLRVTCISEEGGDLAAKAGHQISPMYSLNSIGVL